MASSSTQFVVTASAEDGAVDLHRTTRGLPTTYDTLLATLDVDARARVGLALLGLEVDHVHVLLDCVAEAQSRASQDARLLWEGYDSDGDGEGPAKSTREGWMVLSNQAHARLTDALDRA